MLANGGLIKNNQEYLVGNNYNTCYWPMRTIKTEIRDGNNKLIKLKSKHYEIIVKRPVVKDAEQTKELMPQV